MVQTDSFQNMTALEGGIPASHVAAHQFARVYFLVSVTYWLVTLIICLKTWKKKHQGKRPPKSFLFFFTYVVGGLLTHLCGLSQAWTDWQGNEVGCQVVAKIIAWAYPNFNTACYLFLFERSTLTTFGQQSKLFNLVKHGVLFLTLQIPIIAILSAILFQGVILPDSGFCIMLGDSWMYITVTVGDTAISMGYLYLFMVPVLKLRHASQASKDSKDSKLNKAIRKNFWGSIAAVVSTFAAMIFMTLGDAYGRQSQREHFWYIHTNYVGINDMVVNTIIMQVVAPGVWLPNKKDSVGSSGTRSGRNSIVPNPTTTTFVSTMQESKE